MENTLRKKLISKTLSKKFLYDKEAIKQEELIQKWKYPELEGYEGLLAFNSLVHSSYETLEDDEHKQLNNSLEVKKKNDLNFHIDLYKDINNIEKSLLGNCMLHNYYYGENNISIRDMAKKYKVSKSYLCSIIRKLRANNSIK